MLLSSLSPQDAMKKPEWQTVFIFAFSRWRALVTEVGEIPSKTACSDTGNWKWERI